MSRLFGMGMVALAAMATGAQALEPGDPGYWDGFYAGILGGAGAGVPPTTGEFINFGIAAGAGATTNDGFYFGAEAFLAGESFNAARPISGSRPTVASVSWSGTGCWCSARGASPMTAMPRNWR